MANDKLQNCILNYTETEGEKMRERVCIHKKNYIKIQDNKFAKNPKLKSSSLELRGIIKHLKMYKLKIVSLLEY